MPPHAELRDAHSRPPGAGGSQPGHTPDPQPSLSGDTWSQSPGAQGRAGVQLEGPGMRTKQKTLVHPLMGVLLCPFMNSAIALCWTLGIPGCLRPSLPVQMGKLSC